MNFIFGIKINITVFYKLILSFWLCKQSYPKNKNKFAYLAISPENHWVGGTLWVKLIFCLQINNLIKATLLKKTL